MSSITIKIEGRDEYTKFTLYSANGEVEETTSELVARAVERLQRTYDIQPEYHGRGRANLDVAYVGTGIHEASEHLDYQRQADPAAELIYAPKLGNEELAAEGDPAIDADQPVSEDAPSITKPEPTKPASGRRTNEQIAADHGVELDDVKEWLGAGQRVKRADIEEFAKLHPAAAVANQTLDEAAQEPYDQGSVLPPGPQFVRNNSGEPEEVVVPSQQHVETVVPESAPPAPAPAPAPESTFTEATGIEEADAEAFGDWNPFGDDAAPQQGSGAPDEKLPF
jgi:hypothetical protein